MKNLAVVILAAGQGTRMKSRQAKVLHKLCGWPLICHVIARVAPLKPRKIVAVVGRQFEEVKDAVLASKPRGRVEFALQKRRLGTGHAVLAARPLLADFSGDVLILSGDVPLLSANAMTDFISGHRRARAGLSVMSFKAGNPFGYGRILRDGKGGFTGIVEQKDATPEQLGGNEANAGVYVVKAPLLFSLLPKLRRNNEQGEYYLTDIVGLAAARGERCAAFVLADAAEAMGINTRMDLAAAEQILRMSLLELFMESGVTVMDPATTYVDMDVRIGMDTVIHPRVALREGTVVGENCVIEDGVQITRSRLADGVHCRAYSVIEDAVVGEGASIGPFARLRSSCRVGKDAMVGNFVELYGARIGDRSKVRRLSYLADTDVGSDTHIGAGTVTCNFDGIKINRSKVGSNVFIGSDSQIIAPVDVGDNAHVATGSTITRDIPRDCLYVTRGQIVMREGWATRYRKIDEIKQNGDKKRKKP